MLNNNLLMDEVTPIKFFLSQNYPNPFNEKTIIKYCVAYKTRVQITVYNSDGKLIEKLVDEEKNPGTYEVEFSTCHSGGSAPGGQGLPNGYYFYRMFAEDYSSEKKWFCINNLLRSNTMKSFLQTLFFFLLVTQIYFAQVPVISVTPDSLSEDLLSGKSNDQILTISNNGESDLTFEINVKENSESSFILSERLVDDNYFINKSDQTSESISSNFSNSLSYSRNYTSLNLHTGLTITEKYLLGGLKILLITSAYTTPDEIRNALLSFPDIQTVDVFDAYTATPTLNQLLPYHTVIIMNDTPYADPVAMGNVLANYVDAGRGLIMTIATFAYGWEVQGRLLNEDYFPFNLGYGPAGSASLGTFNQNHPIMLGVTNATSDLLADVTVANSAELIASWDNNFPFVATKGRNVVAVNAFVTTPGGWTGDIPLILHNAAFWASSCGWLSAEPDSGTITAGSSMNISMNFDAAGLSGGEYNANIKITSNDPVTPELIVPAHLYVTDAPAIWVQTDDIDFGEVFLNVTKTFLLEVRNIGSQDLLIFSAAIQPSEYTVSPTFAGIDPGENEIFTITFLPTAVGNYQGTLTLNSNDPVYSSYVINLNGQGVEPPIIVVYPDSLVVGVLPGSTKTKLLTISNQGQSNLYFNVIGGFSLTNYALQFNGMSTYVQCPNSSSLNIEQSITFEAWVYPFTWDGNPRILEKGGVGGAPCAQYEFLAESGEFKMTLVPVNPPSITCPLPSTNTWHHCASVYDYAAQQMQLYVEGVKVSENLNVTGQIATTSDALYIGSRYNGWSIDYFNGIIDELRIWNIARSESDIQKYMH